MTRDRAGAWTDRDLAIGLSRTYRWAGYSVWDLRFLTRLEALLARAKAGRGRADESPRRAVHTEGP
jgi:hypothetical protein